MGVAAALSVRLSADISDVEKKLNSLDQKFGSVGLSLSKIGGGLTAGLTLPLVAAAAGLAKVGKSFDEAFDLIRAKTGATGKQLESFGGSFKTVLSSVPASMADTATAIADLHVRTGQTGVGLEAMATQMLNLSRLTGSDVAPMIQTTTRLFGDWSIATNEQSAALDFLFKTSQSTGIGVTRLSDLIVQFGAPLRALGFEFEQAAALMGKWEKEGVNIETVLSGLRFALGNFAKAGLEPAAALKAVQQAILGARTESEATGIAFQVFGKRAAVDMSRAILEGRFNIDQLVTSLKASKETINGAAASTLSLGERMQLLGNKVLVAVEPLATKFVGALEKIAMFAIPVVAALGSMVGWFADLPGPILAGVAAFLALVAAVGPLLVILGQLVLAFQVLAPLVPMATREILTFGGGARLGAAAVVSATLPILAFTAAIGALIFALPKAIASLMNLWDVWSKFGTKALIGELGRNVKDDDLSFFKDWRVDQQPKPGRRKGRSTLPGSGDAAAQLENLQNAMGGGPGADISKLFKPGKVDRVNPFSGSDLFRDADQAMKDISAVGGVTRLTADETTRLHEILDKAIEKYHAMGKTVPADMARVWGATIPPPAFVSGMNNLLDWTKSGKQLEIGTLIQPPMVPLAGGPGVAGMPDELPGATGIVPGDGIKLPGLLAQAFGSSKDFGGNLANTVMGAFQGGGNVAKSIGGSLGGSIAGKLGGALASKVGGVIGGALGSVIPVFGTILGGMAGSAIGGLVSKLFGGDKKKTNKARDAFIEEAGGIDALKKAAEAANFSLDKLLSTNKVKDFQSEVGKLTSAMEAQKATMQAIGDITAGVNTRSGNISGQGDLDVVGAGAVAAFALQMQNGSTAIAAFQALTPAITAMSTAMATGNFTLSESAMRLTELGAILNANNVEFTNLGASGQILSAMLQGNIRDGTLFAAVATDIGTQIQTVIDRGVPMAQVFALAQPQLQALWEAQQKWGFAVDATTQGLLTEAAAQGFVGAAMKSVNQQILDVLLAIGKVLGADIPEALANLPAAAASAAAGMNAAFDTVRGPSTGDMTVDDVPAMGKGGIVRKPTLALIGESGPEIVQPLDNAFNTGGGTAIIHLDGRQIARAIVPRIPGEVLKYGVG